MLANSKNLYITVDGESIEFMHYFMEKIFCYGYLQERKRMSDISIRCHHHNVQFNDNPKEFISYIVGILYIPLKKGNISTYSLDKHQKECTDILQFVSNGICQICALYLASELETFLPITEKYVIELGAIHLIGNILTTILQYPSVAIYYFRDKYDLWRCIAVYFAYLANVYHACMSNSYEEAVECTRNGLLIFGLQIMRNSYLLLNHFDYWNINLIGFIQWIIKEIEFQINVNIIREYQLNPLLNVYFMILSYFYLIKTEYFNDAHIRIFKKKLLEIVNDKYKDRKAYYCIIIFMCKHLLEIIDVKSRKKALKKYCTELKRIKRKVWKQKRKDMKCLWYKCYVKAKDLDKGFLYKCNRCKIARYCSKKCQKKDWNIGCHKELCDKYCN